MKASYYWLPVLVAVAGVGRAADPAPGVLLLDDFRLVEGRVERFGNLYRVTADGTSQLVNELQVVHRAATRADVLKYVTDRADTATAAGRAKLAGWFLKVGEPDRAVVEARAAAELAPTDAGVKALVSRCEQAVLKARAPATVTPLPAPPPVVLPPAPKPPTTRPAEVGSDATVVFGARVQPILMNVCAKCHAQAGYTGAFKLERVPEGYANAAGTAANLAAAAGQLNRQDPAASPMLAKAIAAHGGAKLPPLAARTHPAFRNLEAWVYAAVGPPRPATAPPPPAEPAKLPPLKAEPAATSKNPGVDTPGSPVLNPDDPFDPAAFNRRAKTGGK